MKKREIRIFISSTFRDMHAEREELIKKVFPALAQVCRQRGVKLIAVDLRWGITKEQAEKGKALPVCLSEIEKCHPYFIGLLGERYGWVPDKIDPRLLEQHPWLKEHREHSITELELVHGVLQNRDMNKRSFFYFRDPDYVRQLPEERKEGFVVENPAAKEKLERL